MPLSIVMPTYNGMRYLRQAIDSVLSQGCQEWELIVSDDGSNDGTRDYLVSLQDSRIKIHFQPKNLGIFGNLNFLFSKAKYELTQILCQDDYFVDRGALERLLAEWIRLPREVAFLRCNQLSDIHSRLERFQATILPSIIRCEDSDLLFFVFGCIPGNLSNVSVRTRAVETAGWFRTDLPYVGDFEFWSRLGTNSPWALSKAAVTHIREHDERASVALNKNGEKLKQALFTFQRLYDRLTSDGYPSALLRLMVTINYTSRQRDWGVKEWLRGMGSYYLQRVSEDLGSSSLSFGNALDWLIYFACLGGRVFTVTVAKQLLGKRFIPPKKVGRGLKQSGALGG